LQKCFVFLTNAYVFSSRKLEIRAEQILLGSGEGVEGREEAEGEGRNDPNNVCIYE
jgi:hypothetical protein